MKKSGGFTLLELLMVVIIIGILASIALPQYLRMAERTRTTEALTVLAALRSSELRFKAQAPAGTYTTAPGELDTEIPGFGGNPASALWTYSVSGTAAGSNGVATRSAGQCATKTVEIDLDSGKTCTPDTTCAGIWGTTSGTC